ncbi:MAG: putative lipid kinase [Acidimicrobiales bacterium]|nr:putative lipid kinase [Acidimicrobiales bacterium]
MGCITVGRHVKVLLVVNPFSSSVTARSRVVIRKALSGDHDVTLAETSRRGNAIRLARGAASDGADVVVALGGDGTVNEVANGLAGSDTALAVLPGGSTNVFARTLGLPNDPIECTGALLEALDAGSIRRVGLGSVNGRYFCFHVGIGYDAAVVEQVERRGSLKRWAGHPLFVYAAFATWFRHYDKDRPRFSVSYPDGHEVADGYFGICCNTNPYTFLGNRPLDIAPEAGLDRGLVMITIRSMRFTRIIGLAGRALRGGGHVAKDPSVDYRVDATKLVVASDRPFPYQVDGDFIGQVTRLELRHEPAVLDLVLPADSPA